MLREHANSMDRNETTSSEQVFLEETRLLSESERTELRRKALEKMGRSFSFELEEPDSNENVFVRISEACKTEAARQSNMLLQVAEGLCNEESPTLQRKGKVYKKLAPEVEKHVFNEMQQDLCKTMWREARQRVFGTPSHSDAVTKTSTVVQNGGL